MKVDRILMAHGSGGLMSQELIERVFQKKLEQSPLGSHAGRSFA